jgi:ABC-type polysaccharide/polyol phosphate transport system ATPase subunit
VTSIVADNLSVEFPVPNSVGRSLRTELVKRSVGAVIRRGDRGHTSITALSGINLNLKEGDRLGLMGHNGAGKSTLLRTLAGVYPVTHGTLRCVGSITTLFNLSFGMDPEMSGRQNILMRGLFAGRKRAEILQKVDEIIEFSDLGEFLDMPFHSYSSGMRLRLSFAISTAFPADILLVDESIGAGDANFRQKSEQRIAELIGTSGILVLASHSKPALTKYCNKFLTLERGRIVSLTDSPD